MCKTKVVCALKVNNVGKILNRIKINNLKNRAKEDINKFV